MSRSRESQIATNLLLLGVPFYSEDGYMPDPFPTKWGIFKCVKEGCNTRRLTNKGMQAHMDEAHPRPWGGTLLSYRDIASIMGVTDYWARGDNQ